KQLRQDDNEGRYSDAVALATGAGPKDVRAVFAQVDTGLDYSIAKRNELFSRESAAAERDLVGSGVAVVVLTLLLVSGAAIGVQQRMGEYRGRPSRSQPGAAVRSGAMARDVGSRASNERRAPTRRGDDA